MTRIVIIGASGYIGKFLLNALQKIPYEILAIEHNSPVNSNVNTFSADITNPSVLDNILKDDDVVINLVGQVTPYIKTFTMSNILGNIYLLNSCVKKKIKKIIFLSTINVYGENLDNPSLENDSRRPNSDYANIKCLVEDMYKIYSKQFNLNVSLLRLSNIYGPDDSGIIGKLIHSLDSNEPITVYHNGEQIRDFLFIDDFISGIVKIIDSPPNSYEIINFSSGIGISINDLISIIEKISNKKVNVKFSSETPDEHCLCANNTYAKTNFNFQINILIEEGIKKLIHKI
jgi:UDP-glucose 4-epimerase